MSSQAVGFFAVCAILSVLFLPAAANPAQLYVALNGNDAWSGRLHVPNAAKTDGPFATLTRARDAVRELKKAGLPEGGVKVVVRGGTYSLDAPLELTAEDSGTEDAPVSYWAYRGEEVRLLGGKVVTNWQPVTDKAVLAKLDESARGNVVQADLKALGITDFGSPGGGGMELFYNREPMTVSRWPNEGFVKIPAVHGKTERNVRGTKGCAEGLFEYEGDRPKRWTEEKDAWVHGYWFWDWAEQRHKIKSIDTEKRILEVEKPYHNYGYRKGQWFYAFNLLSEIDQPGEWYVDREAGMLYFWPPDPTPRAGENHPGLLKVRDGPRHGVGGETVVSVLPGLTKMGDASHLTLRGFTLEGCRGTAITMSGGTGNRVVGCTIRNVGGWAVTVVGGTNHGVVGCDMYNMGGGGISLNGGDRKTLTPAGHFAENNHVHHYARVKRVYQPGITLQGVGNRASHNLIHDAPHMGMGFGGNDHTIEFNEIHSVCYESNDAGAIYTGRNWIMRGTVIRHNYLHHLNGFEGRGCVGVYLDDMFCGTEISGNLFYDVTRAAFVGGGRDCTIENNLFVDCKPAIHIDSRALGWAKGHTEGWIKEGREKGTHLGIRFMEPPYSERWPQLLKILDDEPFAPKGNVVTHNVSFGGQWNGIDGRARPYATVEDNLFDEDPHFATPDRIGEGKEPRATDFALKADSPAWAVGFKKLPLEQMGLYQDASRASWPVTHHVRSMVRRTEPQRVARNGQPPVFKVARAKAPVVVDGVLSRTEWAGADPKQAMVIEQGLGREKLTPRSLAWLQHDGKNLLVAIDNEVDPSKALSKTNTWGQDDAVEVALRNPAGGNKAPLFVLRGYPNGHFESSTEAGAPEAAARKAGDAVRFAAKVIGKDRWTAEYSIPLAALGLDPRKHTKLAFNLTVRKAAVAKPVWMMWQGTGGYSWSVESAGFVELVK